MKKAIPYLVIVFLIGVIFIMRECQKPVPPTVITHTDTIVKTETITIEKVVEKPVVTTEIDSFPVNTPVDTMAILADWYKVRNYDSIPLQNDSIAHLYVQTSVYKNRLQTTKLKGDIYKRVEYITQTTTIPGKPSRKIFVGFQMSAAIPSKNEYNFEQFGVAVGAMYQSRKDHAYAATYDPFNKTAQVHTYWKIGKK